MGHPPLPLPWVFAGSSASLPHLLFLGERAWKTLGSAAPARAIARARARARAPVPVSVGGAGGEGGGGGARAVPAVREMKSAGVSSLPLGCVQLLVVKGVRSRLRSLSG